MNSLMNCKACIETKGLATYFTFIRFLYRMSFLM